MEIAQQDVKKIELAKTFVLNGNSRTIRITANDYHGQDQSFEIVLYGNTDALDALPKSDDFVAFTDVPDIFDAA